MEEALSSNPRLLESWFSSIDSRVCGHELGWFSSLGLTVVICGLLRICSPYPGRGLGAGLPAHRSQAGVGWAVGGQIHNPVPGEHRGSQLDSVAKAVGEGRQRLQAVPGHWGSETREERI